MKSLSRGPSILVTLKMPKELFRGVEHWRAQTRQSRSAFVRSALEALINEYDNGGIQWDVEDAK